MAARRLTPHQKRVLDALAAGKVLRSLQGWVRWGLFEPDARTTREFVLPETIELIADRLEARDKRTGEVIPTPRAPTFGVEYRLRAEGGAA